MCCVREGRGSPPRRFWATCSRARSRCSSRAISLDVIRPSRLRSAPFYATYIGLLLGFGLCIPLLAFCVTWAVVAAATRYSSLAALLASVAAPMAISLKGDVPELRLFMTLSVLLWLMHHANISRLMSGTESKIGSH